MSKLLNKAKSSKLRQSITSSDVSAENPSKIFKGANKEYPKSYRFDSEIINVLKNTLDRVNNYSNKKVSEARLLKALILLSKDMSEEQLIQALKEVW